MCEGSGGLVLVFEVRRKVAVLGVRSWGGY